MTTNTNTVIVVFGRGGEISFNSTEDAVAYIENIRASGDCDDEEISCYKGDVELDI